MHKTFEVTSKLGTQTGSVGKEREFKSIKPLDLATCTKEQISAYFEETFDLEENLFACLKDASSFLLSPNKLRLPIIFYFGHTPTLFVNKLYVCGFIKERINFEFETLFETGVDEMTWDSVDKQRMGGEVHYWPPIELIVEYRRKVRELVLQAIGSTPLELPVSWVSSWWGLMLTIDHIRIHFELSSVLLRELPVELVERPLAWNYAPREPKAPIGENELIPVPGGEVRLGVPREFPAYAWDSAFGKEHRETPAFKAAKYLTTNAEFLGFIEARGYQKKEYWTVEGWDWVLHAKPCHPHFWVCRQGCVSHCAGVLANHTHCRAEASSNGEVQEYFYRAMFDELEMPWSWPVEVNYHEAKAYCRWRGDSFRLLTEAEKIRIRGEELPPEEGLKSDPAFANFPPFNLNLQFCSSTPVNYFPPSSSGFHDAYGNVWEWTECHYNALEGFETHKLYDNYSTTAFDGRHNLMLGGCWASSGSYASRFYRNTFRRHFFQNSGFRVVEALDKKNTPVRLCSSRTYTPGKGFSDNCVCVFGSEPGRNVRESANAQLKTELEEAFQLELKRSLTETDIIIERIPLSDQTLDSFIHIGCGVGKICYILSRKFKSVLGIDYSGRFIEFCNRIASNSGIMDLGGLEVPDDIARDRLTFKQFSWLPNEIPISHIVLVTILDRVMNPEAWAIRLFEIVKKSGVVIVVSRIPLDRLERIMNNLHLETIETPFTDPSQILSVWQRKV